MGISLKSLRSLLGELDTATENVEQVVDNAVTNEAGDTVEKVDASNEDKKTEPVQTVDPTTGQQAPATTEDVLEQVDATEKIVEEVLEKEVSDTVKPVVNQLDIYKQCLDVGITDPEIIDEIYNVFENNNSKALIDLIGDMYKSKIKAGTVITSTNVNKNPENVVKPKKRLY